MLGKWRWRLLQISRLLWVRATIFSALAILTSLVSIYLAPLVPDDFSNIVGSDAVDSILTILASSMLAVTTFSLTVMVTAYAAAANNATPRATKLLIQDKTTQNVLGTFLGSFLFSLVGIIALSTGLYGEKGRTILFGATILVVVAIVVTFVRWIDYISTLGRLGETMDRVEDAAESALRTRIEWPYLGGRQLRRPAAPAPASATVVPAEAVGYVQHVDVEKMSDYASSTAPIHVLVLPGQFVGTSDTLAWCDGAPDDEAIACIRQAFTISRERSFEQDPRFGLIVLSEIAARALSPAINDPGTAIDIIGRAVRVLTTWVEDDGAGAQEPAFPNVLVPALDLSDLFDDVFTPIARDGAANVGVQIRLMKAFRALASLGDAEAARMARHHARLALVRAEAGMAIEEDITVLRRLLSEEMPELGLAAR